MKKLICLGLMMVVIQGFAQETKTKNLILVTLDGFRWQELFNGADSVILYNDEYVKDISVRQTYGGSTAMERRKKLMPFFWNTIGTQGQLYGNREFDNKINCSNHFLFSYPGYSELLVGFVDKSLHSNRKVENPNSNVLEFIESRPGFENQVAVFSTWDVIPSIARESTNGIPMNSSGEASAGIPSERELLLTELEQTIFEGAQRSDAFTFYKAFEYAKRSQPKVLFISFDETDSHAHAGKYDEYLTSAHKTDKLLQKLWEWIQSQPAYKDQTTMVITTDHGRGKNANGAWTDHSPLKFGSSQIWFTIIGPDTAPRGEVRSEAQYFQNQLAATMAAVLGYSYYNREPVGQVIAPAILLNNSIESETSGNLPMARE